MLSTRLKRIYCCLAFALGLAIAAVPARAQPVRIVALDWTAAAMAASLGIEPVGVADSGPYRQWVVSPSLPPDVVDVGLRGEPNLELVASLRPDLILTNPLGAASRPLLEGIAPTREIDSSTDTADPLQHMAKLLRALGAMLGRSSEAEAVISQAENVFTIQTDRLGIARRPSLLVVQFLDGRFVRIYGGSSLFGGVLARLGFSNAWTAPVNQWGFSLAGIEKLAAFPDADIVVIDPLPQGVSMAAGAASLWSNLPAVRHGRVRRLAASWPFGELTAAERFARLLTDSYVKAPAHAG